MMIAERERELIMLSFYCAMLVDAEQNRPTAQRQLDIPVLARGGSSFIGDRNESQIRLMSTTLPVTSSTPGHDLAEEYPARRDDRRDPAVPGRTPAVKRGECPDHPVMVS
jgi:hypothetical protein